MFSMNRLSLADRAKILGMLVEGNSLRSCARMADVSLNTVTKLLVDLGAACEQFHDATMSICGTCACAVSSAMKFGASWELRPRTSR
jgi:hypothetical protein